MKKIVFYSIKEYEEKCFNKINKNNIEEPKFNFIFKKEPLNQDTVHIAKNADAICIFVNDIADKTTLEYLAKYNIKLILLRCAGFNNIDIITAEKLGITIARVPEYSPYAVAEHAVGLMLNLNRKIHKAYNRTRENNFDLTGLIGFDMYGKTAGIIGTGRIGSKLAKILLGFGMKVLAYDLNKDHKLEQLGIKYVNLNQLLQQSDIISLHCPLTPKTKYLINTKSLSLIKPSCLLINTSRGSIVDTKAVINALKNNKLGGFGLDVYEHESDLFFKDLSNKVISDDILERLMTFPNVILTGHQAFLTNEALDNIAQTTLENMSNIINNKSCSNIVTSKLLANY